MSQNDDRTQENRADRRNDDTEIDPGEAGTVHIGCANDVLIDAAQCRKEHCHDKARCLPDCCDHNRVDRHVRIDQPVELEARPAEVMHHAFKAKARIKKPFPDSTRHDKGQGHRIKEDRAKRTFGANTLIKKNCQKAPDDQAGHDKQTAKDQQVFNGNMPAFHLPQTFILPKPCPIPDGKHARLGKRHIAGPQDEPVDKKQGRSKGRCNNDLGQMTLDAGRQVAFGALRSPHNLCLKS